MGGLYALASSMAYGFSDFLGGVASRRRDPLAVVALSFPISTVLMALLVPVLPGAPGGVALAWGAVSGVLMAYAMFAFYRALSAGPVSVVSPLTAVIVAAVPCVAGLLLGERLTGTAAAGIALACVAVVMVSQVRGGAGGVLTRQVVVDTIGSGTAFALGLVAVAQIPEGSGILPIVVSRAVASAAVVAVALLRRVGRPRADRGTALAVAIGAVDVVANATMYYTFQAGTLAVGSVLIALYPAVTVALAVLVLKERLSGVQGAGIVAALTSVAVITLA